MTEINLHSQYLVNLGTLVLVTHCMSHTRKWDIKNTEVFLIIVLKLNSYARCNIPLHVSIFVFLRDALFKIGVVNVHFYKFSLSRNGHLLLFLPEVTVVFGYFGERSIAVLYFLHLQHFANGLMMLHK